LSTHRPIVFVLYPHFLIVFIAFFVSFIWPFLFFVVPAQSWWAIIAIRFELCFCVEIFSSSFIVWIFGLSLFSAIILLGAGIVSMSMFCALWSFFSFI